MERGEKTGFTVNPPFVNVYVLQALLKGLRVFLESGGDDGAESLISLSRSVILDSKVVSHRPCNHSVRTNGFLWGEKEASAFGLGTPLMNY